VTTTDATDRSADITQAYSVRRYTPNEFCESTSPAIIQPLGDPALEQPVLAADELRVASSRQWLSIRGSS
jgi:hypothetical protein